MTWIVGKREGIIRRWFKNGTEVSTGTSTVIFSRETPTGREYLQSDATTWGASSATFSQTFVSGVGWRYVLQIPDSAKGFTVVAEATHSDASLPPLPETNYVTEKDLDAVIGGDASTIGIKEVA